MEPFYCLIHRTGDVPDLWLREADSEAAALEEIDRRAPEWRPFSEVELYQGERRIPTPGVSRHAA